LSVLSCGFRLTLEFEQRERAEAASEQARLTAIDVRGWTEALLGRFRENLAEAPRLSHFEITAEVDEHVAHFHVTNSRTGDYTEFHLNAAVDLDPGDGEFEFAMSRLVA
jgi:hypothetical protein